MNKLKILLRMLRNRLLSSNPTLKSAHTSVLDRVAFVLNFFPPYNLACWLWINLSTRLATRFGGMTSVSWRLMKHGFLFGALRHLSPEARKAFAETVVLPVLAQKRPIGPLGENIKEIVRPLNAKGFAKVGPVVSRSAAVAATDYFCQQQGFASQTPLQSDGVLRRFDPASMNATDRYFCFSSATSLACPEVAAVLSGGRLREIAAAYLGFMPVLYSVNTIATSEGTADHYVMRMHRDYDAFASLTFFVCWTSVSASNGATIYIPGSHFSSQVDESQKEFLEAEAGEAYAVDTFGRHSGNKEVRGVRLTTWVRFSSVPNLGTIQDPDLVPRYQFA